jgi:soluble lytic murein transglycosylase-like protein
MHKLYNKILKTLNLQGLILSGLLAIAGVGVLSGNCFDECHGDSLYSGTFVSLEKNVFKQIALQSQIVKNLLRKEEEAKILRVISGYRTGLDEEQRQQIPGLIIDESKKYGYDPLFLTAIIVTESSFNNWARSNQGAFGLMQILPTTGISLALETQHEWEGEPTLFDPGTNIALGTYYFHKLVRRFGNMRLALEAYNHGPSRLRRYLNKGETPKFYSQKVFRNYDKIRSLQSGYQPQGI